MELTAGVMAAMDSNQSSSRIKRLMNELNNRNSQTYCFPEMMNASSFFIHLVHQGALHEESANRYACPIPSFRTYLLKHGGIAENSNLQPQAT